METIFFKSFRKKIRSFFFTDHWTNLSWSQDGEDLILKSFFDDYYKGFYIDVGAHHPKRFSNTYFFYRKGWSGINIDATPGSMKNFHKHRKRDINIEMGIDSKEGEIDFYVFNEPALNGFSKELSLERNDAKNEYFLKEIIEIKVSPLCKVLEQHLPKSKVIDFLNIDVEGLDYNVLISNNWERFRPKFVLVEILASTVDEVEQNKISIFLNKMSYSIVAKTMYTVIFKDNKF